MRTGIFAADLGMPLNRAAICLEYRLKPPTFEV